MAGVINWKKAPIPGNNPDQDHVYVGVDPTDSVLYIKNNLGQVFKYPTSSDVSNAINSSLTEYDKSSVVNSKISSAIADIVDSSPATLDTLNEIATALGDDPNFATTITTLIGTKEPMVQQGTQSQYYRGDKTWQLLDKSVIGLQNVLNVDSTQRSNHIGTQLASTISDFAISSLGVLLSGISFSTNIAITASDSILSAFGKIQAQIDGHFSQGGSSVHPVATTLLAGFMSSSDKAKLDEIGGLLTKKTVRYYNCSSSTTPTDLTDLSFSMINGKQYDIEISFPFSSSSIATGIQFCLTKESAASAQCVGLCQSFSTTSTISSIQVSGFDSWASFTSSATTNQNIFYAKYHMLCTSTGLVTPRIRTEINGSMVQVLGGGIIKIVEV